MLLSLKRLSLGVGSGGLWDETPLFCSERLWSHRQGKAASPTPAVFEGPARKPYFSQEVLFKPSTGHGTQQGLDMC